MSWRLVGAWTLLVGSILGMAVTFPLWLLNLVSEAANMTDRIHDGND